MAKLGSKESSLLVGEDGLISCSCGAKSPEMAVREGYGTIHYEQFWSCPACDEAVAIAVKKELEELPF